MAEWRKFGGKLLFPPLWLTVGLAVVSAAGLCLVFLNGWEDSPIAYAVYTLAFYALCVLCAACSKAFPKLYRKIKRGIYGNRFGRKYMTDAAYRTHFSFYVSLGINLLYVAMNLFTGLWYRSVWSITLAAYYSILAVMRFLLLRFTGRVGIGNDRVKELRRSQLCGAILMTVNLALTGVVILVIVQDKGFAYPGMLIYVMAMYAFYVTTHSVVNLFKYRKYNSPVMSTAKAISLAAALVSMLSLETAMLSQFSTEAQSPYFKKIMVGATGAGVCVIVVAMAVTILIRTNRELKKLCVPSTTEG